MELIHGRVHDVCPDCGAEIHVAPLSSFMQTLKASGFDGVAPVVVHALPLCPEMQNRAENAWKEIRTRAEDEMAKARDEALTSARDKRAKRDEQRNQKPQSQK